MLSTLPARLPASPGNHKFVFYICDSFCFVKKFICTLFLDSTYMRYHMMFVFLCLTYFTQYDNLQMALFCSFFKDEKYSIVYMYHIFFIHSSVDGHNINFLNVTYQKIVEPEPRWRSRRTCAHSLLREHQNHNYLLNNHREEDTGTHQKRYPTSKDKGEATMRQ